MVRRGPRLIYTTGPEGPTAARRCPDCGAPPIIPASAHAVRVRRERSGRKGKTVTVAGPFHLAGQDATRLVKQLKSACGSGGTVKTATNAAGTPCQSLEIQGDHVERVVELLRSQGFPAKRAGG